MVRCFCQSPVKHGTIGDMKVSPSWQLTYAFVFKQRPLLDTLSAIITEVAEFSRRDHPEKSHEDN